MALALNSPEKKLYCANYDGSGISVIAFSPPVFVEDEQETQLIPQLSLEQNHPNPFNPATTIRYAVSSADSKHTMLEIFNILGQKVRTLVDEPRRVGSYEVAWDGKDDEGEEVASGIYLYRLRVGEFSQFRKMLLMK